MSITIEMRRVPVANDKAYVSMDEFRKDALSALISPAVVVAVPGGGSDYTTEPMTIADHLVKHADEVIEILTLNTRSRPQMRKDRKARKPRKQEATLPLPDNT